MATPQAPETHHGQPCAVCAEVQAWGFVPAEDVPTTTPGRSFRGLVRRLVAMLDRLNGSKPLQEVRDADYAHLMRVTDT